MGCYCSVCIQCAMYEEQKKQWIFQNREEQKAYNTVLNDFRSEEHSSRLNNYLRSLLKILNSYWVQCAQAQQQLWRLAVTLLYPAAIHSYSTLIVLQQCGGMQGFAFVSYMPQNRPWVTLFSESDYIGVIPFFWNTKQSRAAAYQRLTLHSMFLRHKKKTSRAPSACAWYIIVQNVFCLHTETPDTKPTYI